MRFLIFTVSLFLATTVYANDHNINKSGFLSKKLSVSALSKIDNPEEKIILIYNHGQNTFDGSSNSCTDYGQIRNQGSLVGERINGKEIMVYNLCTHKIKGDMPLKWWISKDKPYVGKTKIDKRVEANLQLVKQLNSLGVPKNQIFVTGHSCGGLTTLLFFSRHPDEAAGGIAYMQACFGQLTKQYKVKKLGADKALEKFKKKRPGPYKVREKFNDEIKNLKVPLLAFTHPKDNYEGLLSDWLEDIPGMKRIVISDDFKINGKKCKKKGKNQTEPIKKGHNMDQGTCFQYYNSEIKNYIKSRI